MEVSKEELWLRERENERVSVSRGMAVVVEVYVFE